MKMFVFLLMLTITGLSACSALRAGDLRVKDEVPAVPQETVINVVEVSPEDAVLVKQTADEVVKVLTGNKDAEIVFPEKLNIASLDSLMTWWVWLTNLLTPILILMINKLWPSSNKKELIIKSSSMGIIIIWAVILLAGGGFNTTSVVMSLVMFIIQALSYDKILKPLGLVTSKPSYYKKT